MPPRTAAAVLAVLALSWRPAAADLAEQDPQVLCRLLEPLGVVTTAYGPPASGERPRCFAAEKSADGRSAGVLYRYAVLAHWAEDHPQALWLSVEGAAADIASRAPQQRFVAMADRVLQALVTDATRQDILLGLQSLRPGDTLWQMVEGLSIQLRWIEPDPAAAAYVGLRLDVSDVCADLPRQGARRQACLAQYWVADRPFAGARLH